MFNPVSVTRGLTFTKIIGGINKTLQIANQIIPIYQKAKPLISNARSVLGVLKDINKAKPKIIESTNAVVVDAKQTINTAKKEEIATSPTFFL